MKQMKAKRIIDMLYYEIGKQGTNFRLCLTFLDNNKEVRFSKWKPYSAAQEDENFISNCNQREIMFHEIVFDLDNVSIKEYNELIDQLEKENIAYAAFMTQSKRAMHIHTYWRKIACMPKYRREMIREHILRKFNCDPALKSDSHLIPIEFLPHWKTGEIKQLYRSNMGVYNDFE
jgi:hypothetical protein